MDYRRNEDKWDDDVCGVSYNQVIDYDNGDPGDVVTLTEAKSYMKVEDDSEDDLISSLITAAVDLLEKYSFVNFTRRTVKATANNRNGGIYLPFGPVDDLTSITDADDNNYDYKLIGSKFKQLEYPVMSPVILEYEGGFTECPQQIKTAVKAQVLFMYENRGESGVSPLSVQLLNTYRRVY